MRAKLAALALAIAVTVTAAACGGSDDGSSSPSAGAKDLKGQTITYWASNQAPSIPEDYRIFKREAAKFTAQSGVKVDIKVIGWPDLFNNGLVATAASKGTVSEAQVKAALSDANDKMAAAG